MPRLKKDEIQRLVNIFECVGHFYNITKDGRIILCCRSVLEIGPRGSQDWATMQKSPPGLMVIMMNPGNSSPHDGFDVQNVDIHCLTDMRSDNKSFVPTEPDTTQYWVMLLMERLGVSHARVLNLSDVRQPKSKKITDTLNPFFDNVKAMGHDYQASHSIFSQIRSQEKKEIFRNLGKSKILLAWGANNYPKSEFARVCLEYVKDKEYFGSKKISDPWAFYHPLSSDWINKALGDYSKV